MQATDLSVQPLSQPGPQPPDGPRQKVYECAFVYLQERVSLAGVAEQQAERAEAQSI